MIPWNKGKKTGLVPKSAFKKGFTPWNKDKKLSTSHCENLSVSHIGQKAWNEGKPYTQIQMENHWNWKGGIGSKTRRKLAPRPMPEQCEICGSFGKDFKKGLCLDHNHKTGEFRGWLCTRCNAALGMVNENTEILQALIDYIKKDFNN